MVVRDGLTMGGYYKQEIMLSSGFLQLACRHILLHESCGLACWIKD